MTQTDPLLPHVLSGERREIKDPKAGLISYYVDGPLPSSEGSDSSTLPPLLLVHSINAAASAHEIKPLFDVYKTTRRTYAIDLPGYGHSERSERLYRQRLMIDAIHAVLGEIRAECGMQAVDALAVSLAGEFLAKVTLESPQAIRSLALVSSTGFAKIAATHGPPEADCGRPRVHRVISLPLLGKALFRLLTVKPSIRFFLNKTWGSKQIDEEMYQHATRLSRTPGAHRAPLCFIAGYLFGADMPTVYDRLTHPVWLSHGVRGDFTDFSRAEKLTHKANWRMTVFQTGALPYFELTPAFIEAYDDFLGQVGSGQSVNLMQAD